MDRAIQVLVEGLHHEKLILTRGVDPELSATLDEERSMAMRVHARWEMVHGEKQHCLRLGVRKQGAEEIGDGEASMSWRRANSSLNRPNEPTNGD